jgi:hypothetical protein
MISSYKELNDYLKTHTREELDNEEIDYDKLFVEYIEEVERQYREEK